MYSASESRTWSSYSANRFAPIPTSIPTVTQNSCAPGCHKEVTLLTVTAVTAVIICTTLICYATLLKLSDTRSKGHGLPTEVGKWVPASAEKTKAGMVHSVSGCTRGVQLKCEIPWERVPYLSALEVWPRQIHVYLTIYLTDRTTDKFMFTFTHCPR